MQMRLGYAEFCKMQWDKIIHRLHFLCRQILALRVFYKDTFLCLRELFKVERILKKESRLLFSSASPS